MGEKLEAENLKNLTERNRKKRIIELQKNIKEIRNSSVFESSSALQNILRLKVKELEQLGAIVEPEDITF